MNTTSLTEKSSFLDEKKKTTSKTTGINVQNIPVYCSIGCGKEEKEIGQKLFIDVSLEINSEELASSDNVNDTMSYVDVYKIVEKVSCSKSRNLIEKLADDLADTLLNNKLVQSVRVKIRKPHIPFKDFQGEVSVEVERTK